MAEFDEHDLFTRALRAHVTAAKKGGAVFEQPSMADSGVEQLNGKQYVVLRNVRGILAVYRVRNDGMLKRMKRPPKTLEA